MGKLKYFTPVTVTTKINQAIKVKIALKIKFEVKIDCMLRPEIKESDRNKSPIPNSLNTIL
tara:strand:+ start:1858 stop:2040 length:183 start_codon:yes stop_codon:yes gene_type:complete